MTSPRIHRQPKRNTRLKAKKASEANGRHPFAAGSKRFILVLGGASSGKSCFAEKLAKRLGKNVLYLATGVITDPEMATKVARHRKRRPAHWQTVEAPLTAAEAIAEVFAERPPLATEGEPGPASPEAAARLGEGIDVILLDGLTFYVSNLLFSLELPRRTILSRVKELAKKAGQIPAHVIIVSDEVGLGPVPATELGRSFRDLLGEANQILARAAGEVYLVLAGLPKRLK